MVALHALAAPVHRGFHLLLVGGVAYALLDRVRAVMKLRATLEPLVARQLAPPARVVNACRAAGVDLRHVRVVPMGGVPAFTAGLFHPHIYISDSISNRLPVTQLAAIIAHEEAHRRRRDPLRASAMRVLGCTLFFIPVVRHLGQDMMDEVEITADDEALQCHAVQPLDLAAALVDVSAGSEPDPAITGSAVGFRRDALLDRRVRRLVGEDSTPASHATRRSLASAAFVLGTMWVSGMIVAHPLPAGPSHGDSHLHETASPSPHCQHGTWWVLGHLFCVREAPAATPGEAREDAPPCPHT